MTVQRLTLDRPSAFRRRQFVVPHRRRSRTLRLLKPFLLAVVVVGAPVLTAVWVYTSPRFLLREVQVGSTNRVSMEEIAVALEPLRGWHLLSLSLDDVEGRLAANPWIRSAAIRKELPDRLVVEIEERQPVALLRRGGELLYIDEEGVAIEGYDPRGPVDLVILTVASGEDVRLRQALELVANLDRLAPGLSSELSEIEVLGLGDYRVHTGTLEYPILVSATGLEEQIAKLEGLRPEISRRFQEVEAVDLRFSRQIVIQPAGDPRSQEG